MSENIGNHALVNGLNMYYEIHGSGYPLVLVHGGGSTINTTFGRVLTSFAQNHQVIAVELQAHGRTSDRVKPLSFEQDADDVAALLRHLKITRANVFGFSNGASTTLQIAIRHPQLVNKIVVGSTFYKKDGAYPWFWDFMTRASYSDMPEQLKLEHLRVNPSPIALRTMHDRDLERMQRFQDMKEADIRKIQSPALILIGDNDVVRPEHAVEMYRQIPHARITILPGGHGDYIGEVTTIREDGPERYPAVDVIHRFLSEP
jgi:pimeloyl-ACP methyl ester carboxylesterase